MFNKILEMCKNYLTIIIIGLIIIISTLIILWIKYKKEIMNIYSKYKEIINYVIVGALTTFVSIISYYIFRFIINNVTILSIISWIFAVTFAYVANRKYVFQNKDSNIIKELSKFICSRITTLLIEIILMNIFVSLLGINDMISKIIVQFVVLVLNYILSKVFVFNK